MSSTFDYIYIYIYIYIYLCYVLLKETLSIGMKETRAKTTMITSASSDVGCLKKSLKKKKKKIRPLSVSKSRDVF